MTNKSLIGKDQGPRGKAVLEVFDPSSLSVLTPLSGFSARRDFLAGGPRRAISEPERLAGPVLHFLGCYRAKVLSHSSALESFAL